MGGENVSVEREGNYYHQAHAHEQSQWLCEMGKKCNGGEGAAFWQHFGLGSFALEKWPNGSLMEWPKNSQWKRRGKKSPKNGTAWDSHCLRLWGKTREEEEKEEEDEEVGSLFFRGKPVLMLSINNSA